MLKKPICKTKKFQAWNLVSISITDPNWICAAKKKPAPTYLQNQNQNHPFKMVAKRNFWPAEFFIKITSLYMKRVSRLSMYTLPAYISLFYTQRSVVCAQTEASVLHNGFLHQKHVFQKHQTKRRSSSI